MSRFDCIKIESGDWPSEHGRRSTACCDRQVLISMPTQHAIRLGQYKTNSYANWLQD